MVVTHGVKIYSTVFNMAYCHFSSVCGQCNAALCLSRSFLQPHHRSTSKQWLDISAKPPYSPPCHMVDMMWNPKAEPGSVKRGVGSVLKRDDRVHFVDVVPAIPENSSEVVRVGRVVHLYLVAESPMFGEGIKLSFVIKNLKATRENIVIISVTNQKKL